MEKVEKKDYKIAYFSMEIALDDGLKTYSGGLGILAGDILRSASDISLPMVGVTLLSKEGYFDQEINAKGEQLEFSARQYDFSKLQKTNARATVMIGKDKVRVEAWQYLITSGNIEIPVFLLDTDIPKNPEKYRRLTNQLYGGNKELRLLQETILGRGGYEVLKDLGFKINTYHINEGHGSFVTIARFLDSNAKDLQGKINDVRNSCVFTTHTPIKMAHDVFKLEKVLEVQKDFPRHLPKLIDGGRVNMTKLGLYFSKYINGVALSHKELSKKMFPEYPIHCVTNGVHSQTWTSPELQKLYDKYIPNWRNSSLSLRNAFSLSLDDIWQAHQGSKKRLISLVKEKTGQIFKEDIFTIGFARRFTAYKRPLLLLRDVKRLITIQKKVGDIQIVYAGKAHPSDENGKKLIMEVNKISRKHEGKIKLAFIPGYEIELAKTIIAGSDLWVNTPLPPNEASGTSGMKAAHNGVPQLSSFDGWWREGYIKGKTGWTIRGENYPRLTTQNSKDAASLYDLLEKEIIPIYYHEPMSWKKIMRFSIGVNASFFNTERVLREYAQNAYLK